VTSQTVTVQVAGDVLDEPDESFSLGLSSPVNAVIGDGTGSATISDDDPEPTLSVSNADPSPVTEGNTGTTPVTFTVSLNNPSGKQVTVAYATSNGTAVEPADYAAASGTLTFNPGVTSQTVTVQVAGDVIDEPDESFSVVLSSPVNATIADDTGTGTIADDDAEPTVSVSDADPNPVTEGDSGTTPVTFTVSLSAPSGKQVTVAYATADGTAVEPADYAADSGTLTFNPGQTSQTVTVQVAGDTDFEPDESFTVVLSSPVNAVITDDTGSATIADDDPEPGQPEISISDADPNPVTEGNTGTTPVTFTVSLSDASTQQVTVAYTTSNGTAGSPADFGATSGTLTYNPGRWRHPQRAG
jgi:hypothetical protein